MPSPNHNPPGQEESQEGSRKSMDMGEVEMQPLSDMNGVNNGYADLPPANLAPKTHSLKRFTARAVVNTLGPIFVVAWYLFIVEVYLRRPRINGIIQGYPIDGASVFYAWTFLSVFVLDWAKSGLAGAEASALMTRAWAPNNALQLMWHADRGWGDPGGWWKAALLLRARSRHQFGLKKHATRARGPERLWYYLSLSSILFFVAIPLSGLTMDRGESLRYGQRKIIITGVNETTFNSRTSPFIWEQAGYRWRQGRPASPPGSTILYAPTGTENVSETFFDDAIHGAYPNNVPISFFSGPGVSERAYGRAWGLLVNVTCASVNPFGGLKLLNVTSPDQWYYPLWRVGDQNLSLLADNISVGVPGAPVSFSHSGSFGYNNTVLVASDKDLLGGTDYASESNGALPVPGTLETVLWQAILNPSMTDPSLDSIKSHPDVAVSQGNQTNTTFYGFGITCDFNSTVGFATLDARHRTFSLFSESAAAAASSNSSGRILGNTPGVLAIQTLILGALGNLGAAPGIAAACSALQSITCSQWFGANVATRGVPTLINGPGNITVTRFPALSPERMQVAVYKLVGEMAIAMMASGPGGWTGGLLGLEPARDLIEGRVPWIYVLVLLIAWMVVTLPPGLYVCFRPRWASTLDGFEMFKLGAEWREVVHEIRDSDFQHSTSLQKVPGMIGDMESSAPTGFIGLSKAMATQRREYTYDRDQTRT